MTAEPHSKAKASLSSVLLSVTGASVRPRPRGVAQSAMVPLWLMHEGARPVLRPCRISIDESVGEENIVSNGTYEEILAIDSTVDSEVGSTVGPVCVASLAQSEVTDLSVKSFRCIVKGIPPISPNECTLEALVTEVGAPWAMHVLTCAGL